MYTVTRTGSSIASVIAAARDVPARVVPYAASTALTRVAGAARDQLRSDMPRVLDRPVPYTLNSLRVVPSTVQTLAARVAVKDQAAGNTTPQENYLLPGVEGGVRKEKRFERALRFGGVLRSGERAVPGQQEPLDAYGNVRRSEIARLLAATRSIADIGERATRSGAGTRKRLGAKKTRGGGTSKAVPYFVARIGRTWGLWRREASGVRAVLVFLSKPPTYRRLLDFNGIAERTALTRFAGEFRRAAQALSSRVR